MQFNASRFRKFPELLKLTCMLTAILVLLALANAMPTFLPEPPGIKLVWITAILALIADCAIAMALGFELEGVAFRPGALIGWPLIECVLSAFFAINFFISVWLCVNAKDYDIMSSGTAYALAATFCLAAFVQYVLNVLLYVRIWVMEQRKAGGELNPGQMGYNNYGAP